MRRRAKLSSEVRRTVIPFVEMAASTERFDNGAAQERLGRVLGYEGSATLSRHQIPLAVKTLVGVENGVPGNAELLR
jgi:hypothetical protein